MCVFFFVTICQLVALEKKVKNLNKTKTYDRYVGGTEEEDYVRTYYTITYCYSRVELFQLLKMNVLGRS